MAVKTRRVRCKYEKALKHLVGASLVVIHQIDAAYGDRTLSSAERSQRVARIITEMEILVDGVRYHTFGLDFRKDSPARKAMERKHWMMKKR